MVHYVEPRLLIEICQPDYLSVNFASQLVEVIAAVLDNEVNTFMFRGVDLVNVVKVVFL